MFVAAVVGIVVILGSILWWLKSSDVDKKLSKIPGPTPLPLVGNALQLKRDTVDFAEQILDWCAYYERFSKLFKISIGNEHVVMIYHAETAEKVFTSKKNITKNWVYKFLHSWLRTGLLTSTGDKWYVRRKLLTPTFHFKILIDFLEVFNEHAKVLVKRLESLADGRPVDIFPIITRSTLDVICETAMGKTFNEQGSSGESKYVAAVSGMADLVMMRFRTPSQWNDYLYGFTQNGKNHEKYLKTLHTFTKQVIDERIKEFKEAPPDSVEVEPGKKQRYAFLDLLIRMMNEANLSREDIQEEVDTFMFEGHDTTGSGISWTLQQVGSHPDVQKQIQNELDEVFGDSDRPCTSEDLTHLKYLECAIKESMRMFPPVPVIGREVDEEIHIDDMVIPKGVSIMLLIWRVNRDPKYFPDPESFDPDRFKQENAKGRNPFSYLPFSAGSRNCIGQKFAMNEMKCTVSTVLRRYHLESTQTIAEIRPIPDLILRPTNGIKIKITQR